MARLPDKFAHVPLEDDTRIRSQQQISITGIDALHQRWVWDGIAGESLIFVAGDIPGATDRQILAMARDAGFAVADDDFTIKRTEHGFVFLNFGFDA